MFEKFRKSFAIDSKVAEDPGKAGPDTGIASLNVLLRDFGGSSFKQGLYRIIRGQDIPVWNARINLGFPETNGRVACFGYDWQGSAFAIDNQRLEQGQPGVVLFEPGTGKALKIPANIETFHNALVIENPDAALAANIYAEDWLPSGGAQPAYNECIGYKKPLFLGGEDDISNMEITDLEVYWHIMGQVIAKVKGLPPGTPVNLKGG